MYSTCIFCHSDLGGNESIEHFPVGRRLAFDAERGRLWVVCRKCERWNLTPLEERWEAIEECERLFGATKLRVSTDHIGLARLREGLELIRIGQPQRPEMAAWRYGDQFGRRRRRHLAYTGLGITAGVGLFVAGPITGVVVGAGALLNFLSIARNVYQGQRARVQLSLPGEAEPIKLRAEDLRQTSIEPDGSGWRLNLSYRAKVLAPLIIPSVSSFRLAEMAPRWEMTLSGDDAVRALGKVLPAINASGARPSQVDSAIHMIEDSGDRDALFRRWIDSRTERARSKRLDAAAALRFSSFPREVLLAFEMATHEESERRALEGELSILEEMWRDAEEVAAIADALFVPDETRARLSAVEKRDDDR